MPIDDAVLATMAKYPDADVVVYHRYHPPGVTRVIAPGSSAWIGEVDDSTVFKYPLAPGGDMTRLDTERKLLEVIGPHPRIIGLRGFSETGIYLERAVNRTVADYLLESGRQNLLKRTVDGDLRLMTIRIR